jgi:hypothetical protein
MNNSTNVDTARSIYVTDPHFYMITPKGIERLKRTNNPPLTYEAAQMLAALAEGPSNEAGGKYANELVQHGLAILVGGSTKEAKVTESYEWDPKRKRYYRQP